MAQAGQADARRKDVPGEVLTLDIADPVVTATVEGVTLRLRVELDQKDIVELNPEAFSRLPLKSEPGFPAEVGRVSLPGMAAVGTLHIDGHEIPMQFATHGRDCCAGVDGAISVAVLPYLLVRLTAPPQPGETERGFQMTNGAQAGLQAPQGKLLLRFSLVAPTSTATAAAAVVLAEENGGHFQGAYTRSIGAFGVARPVRMMAFASPPVLAGFNVPRLPVRTADFGGGLELPSEPDRPGDIVVRKRPPRQQAWPAVLIGRDYLDRCTEARFTTTDQKLTLRCVFDAAS